MADVAAKVLNCGHGLVRDPENFFVAAKLWLCCSCGDLVISKTLSGCLTLILWTAQK